MSLYYVTWIAWTIAQWSMQGNGTSDWVPWDSAYYPDAYVKGEKKELPPLDEGAWIMGRDVWGRCDLWMHSDCSFACADDGNKYPSGYQVEEGHRSEGRVWMNFLFLYLCFFGFRFLVLEFASCSASSQAWLHRRWEH